MKDQKSSSPLDQTKAVSRPFEPTVSEVAYSAHSSVVMISVKAYHLITA